MRLCGTALLRGRGMVLAGFIVLALGCRPAERDQEMPPTGPEALTDGVVEAPDASPDQATAPAAGLLGRPPVEHRQWTNRFDPHFRKYSKRFFGVGFDWRWFKAQGIAESSLREDAQSWVGAKGIMQIMPETLKEIAAKSSLPVIDNTDPAHNIAAGVFYDRQLYELWDDIPEANERLAFTLASYNGGRSRILRAQDRCTADCTTWERVTPYAPDETSGYVTRIKALMGRESPAAQGE